MDIVLTQKKRIRMLEAENAEKEAKLRTAEAKLEYVAMMADVDIDEEDE